MSGPQKSQADKFGDLAREPEFDESEEAFGEPPRRVAMAPPPLKDDNLEEEESVK